MNLLNRTEVKKEIFRRWEKKRCHRMTQVATELLDWLEADTKNHLDRLIDKVVDHHPSVGKRINRIL